MTTIDCLPAGEGYAAVHRNGAGPAGRCLLVPPFGVPASALELLAAALDAEGCESLRLDPRNHVGAGTGEITDFRLSDFADDCRRAVERYRPHVVVAISMGARATMRALASTPFAPRAVLLIPVVDVRATLGAILGRDWFAVDEPELPERMPVLGSQVDAVAFRRDCVEHRMVSAEATRRDLAAIGNRATLLPGDDDPWVALQSVEQVVDSLDPSQRPIVRPVACDRHDLHLDAELALRLMGVVLDEVRDVLAESGPVER
ncbi:MAG: alpha/beta fold hydrolase [Actinomycetota bacterium]